MKNLTDSIKNTLVSLVEYVKNFVLSLRGRVSYVWHRIRNGDEPILVRGFVVGVVALAAMFGQIIDPNTVWLIMAFLVPAAVSARGQVSPAEDKNSWWKRLKVLFVGEDELPFIHPPENPDDPNYPDDPDVPVDDGDVVYDDGPVDPDADEPDWLDDFPEFDVEPGEEVR